MNLTPPLTGSHLRTYNTIFQHPISHNLAWHDVHSLFRHIGQVDVEPNGNLQVTRHGQVLVLHAPRTKDVGEVDELMALRHFLERSAQGPAEVTEPEAHWVVVINHREARIYRSAAAGAVAQQIRPHVSEDSLRTAPAAKDFSRGVATPEPNGFFEPVAALLNGAGKILLFGSGTGHSSEMDQFAAWLKQHRPAVAKRIVGSVVIDEHHLTEAQLLAKAREFYANLTAA